MKKPEDPRVKKGMAIIRQCLWYMMKGRSQEDVDDVAQTVMLILIAKIQSGGLFVLKKWLPIVCRNQANRFFAKSYYEKAHRASAQSEDEEPADDGSPREDELREALQRIARSLSVQHRQVLQLMLDGKTGHETAHALGIPAKTAFRLRKEIEARFKAEAKASLAGFFPLLFARGQQAHTVSWAAGVAVSLALLFLLCGDSPRVSEPVRLASLLVRPLAPQPPAPRVRGGGRVAAAAAPLEIPTSAPAPIPAEMVMSATAEPVVPPTPVDLPKSSKRRRKRKVDKGLVTKPDVPVASPPPAVDESRLFGEALSAVDSREYQQALALLEDHASRFPETDLQSSREVMRISVLCALNRLTEAREAERHLRQYHDPGRIGCEVH